MTCVVVGPYRCPVPGIPHLEDIPHEVTVCLLLRGIRIWPPRPLPAQQRLDRIHAGILQVLHQVEAVRHLRDPAGSPTDDARIGTAPVTGDDPDLRMQAQPVCYLLPVPGVEHGQRRTGVVVHDCTHVAVSLTLGKVIQPHIAAGTDLRV